MDARQRPKRMTADEFLAWAVDLPKGERYELDCGELVSMSPERVRHTAVKGMIFRRLAEALEHAGADCRTYTDGLSVRIDERTVYEPDVTVQCGPPPADDDVVIDNPLIVVEVSSPSSRSLDTGRKLDGYFRLSSLRHYLIVKTEDSAIIHHRRDEAGAIATRLVRDGRIELDPPGITIDRLFE
jgi:Uma2 family endonuclease